MDNDLDAFVRGSLPPANVSSARERRLIACTLVQLAPHRISSERSRTDEPIFQGMTWVGFFQRLAWPLTAFAVLGTIAGTTVGLSDPARGLSHLIISFTTTLTGF